MERVMGMPCNDLRKLRETVAENKALPSLCDFIKINRKSSTEREEICWQLPFFSPDNSANGAFPT